MQVPEFAHSIAPPTKAHPPAMIRSQRGAEHRVSTRFARNHRSPRQGRHGRGLSRARSQTETRSRDQDPPRRIRPRLDRLLRFQREAALLASLNHPNIVAIYDIGEDGASRFIVLELVEGETLAERIERGPIPLDDALRIATSICEALEAAHEKGIVHRDLKPANVKLTPDGCVKVLDFGLAKTQDAASGNSALSNSPTLMTMAATNAGVILGTAAYMSPEQARGAVVDKRSDIWAFGIVLYEMLTGKSPFAAPTLSDTLALVLTKDPDVSAVPERVQPLLRRCLERDGRKRLRDIGDAAILLESTPATPINPAAAAMPSKRLSLVLGSIALVSTVAAVVFAFMYLNLPEEMPRLVQFQIPVQGALRPSLSVSPDGRYVAFQVQDAANGVTTQIRGVDSLETRTLFDGPSSRLAWSPDSKSALFFSDRKLRQIDVGGGPVETILETDAGMGPGLR
jgi:serine/threonine protein kinase